MTRWLPYPLLTASLFVMWILLNGTSTGHAILGGIVALIAPIFMTALQPAKPRIRQWRSIPALFFTVLMDITLSNIAVVNIILRGKRKTRTPGFVTIPLQLRDRTGLAVLACIITSTPGTIWVEYHPKNSRLLIHVLDLVSEQDWIDQIKQRYESRLLEIFE
jgi:multicomponent K+:H+ antiporter subunit E